MSVRGPNSTSPVYIVILRGEKDGENKIKLFSAATTETRLRKVLATGIRRGLFTYGVGKKKDQMKNLRDDTGRIPVESINRELKGCRIEVLRDGVCQDTEEMA